MNQQTQQITAKLRSGVESERLEALEQALEYPQPEFAGILAELLEDPQPLIREAAADALAAIGDEAAARAAIKVLSSDRAAARNAAVRVLVRLGHKAIGSLLAAARSDDKDLRKFAVDCLSQIGGDEAVETLTRMLRDPCVNVAAAAAEGLGILGDERAVDALVASLNGDPYMRCTIAKSLGRIGGPKAVEVLSKLATEGDEMVAYAAISALADAADPRALPTLVECLARSNLLLVAEALKAAVTVLEQMEEDAVGDWPQKIAEALNRAVGSTVEAEALSVAVGILRQLGGPIVERIISGLEVAGLGIGQAAVEQPGHAGTESESTGRRLAAPPGAQEETA